MKSPSEHIFVTGAAGFIGSHLCNRLILDGFHVTGVDNLSRGKIQNLDAIRSHARFNFIEADAANPECLLSIEPQTVVHLASGKIPRYDSGWNVIHDNGRINKEILDFCLKKNARLLFASTSDVYGKNPKVPFTESSNCVLGSPNNKRWAYALSKLHTEFLIAAAGREHEWPYQIMRFFGCYGPNMATGWWGGPQSVFLQNALLNEPFEIHGDGLQTRSYIYIDDLVEAIVHLIRRPELDSGIWNICQRPEEEISVIDLARLIQRAVNPSKEPEFTFVPYAQFGTYEDVLRRTGSALKAEQILGWKAHIGLEEGIDRCLKAFRS